MKLSKGLIVGVFVLLVGVLIFSLGVGSALKTGSRPNGNGGVPIVPQEAPTILLDDKPLPSGWTACPGGKKGVRVYCGPGETCTYYDSTNYICNPDPNKPQQTGKKVCTADGAAHWNALCDQGDVCVKKTKGFGPFTFISADCAKKPVDCSASGSNCCPPNGGYFDGVPSDTAKVCGANEKCETQNSPQGYPMCIADPDKPKPDHTICKGKGEGSWRQIWCPNNLDCRRHPGTGYPVCMPKEPKKVGLEIFGIFT